MKTRHELILDFMLALASNSSGIYQVGSPDKWEINALKIHKDACDLADQYIDPK